MSLVPLPSSTDLDAFANPAEHIIALVGPATLLLQEATTVDIADENMSKAKALETWVRANRLGEEAVGAAQTIKLRAAMQVGRLTPKQPTDPRSKGLNREPDYAPQPRRSEFRTLHEHEDEVESYIADRAPSGRATQSGALEAIREATADVKREMERNREDAEAIRSLNEQYQPPGFDSAANEEMVRQRGALSRLCRDLSDLGPPSEFVATHGEFLREHHITLAEAAYAWLDSFLTDWRSR